MKLQIIIGVILVIIMIGLVSGAGYNDENIKQNENVINWIYNSIANLWEHWFGGQVITTSLDKPLVKSEFISLNFGTQEIKTRDFIVQSQTGIDAYYQVSFSHVINSSNIQIDYCINQDKLNEARALEIINETKTEKPYLNYSPDNIRIRKDVKLGSITQKTDEVINSEVKVITVTKPKLDINPVDKIIIDTIEEPIEEPIKETVEINNYCTTLIEDPYLVDMIELGSASTYIISAFTTFSEAILTNITVESNFSHLSISSNINSYGIDWSSLILYMPFDVQENTLNNKTYDYSKNNNDGTLTNGVAFNSSCDLGYGNCYSFDGVNDYVDLGTQVNSYLSITLNYSISLWFNTKNSSQTGDQDIFQSTIDANNSLSVIIRGGNISVAHYNGTWNSVSSPVTGGQWHHVIMVWNGSSNGYLDNVKMTGQMTGTTALTAGTKIGTKTDGTVPFNGSIDEVMIFNTTLNSSQISTIYNNQSQRFKSQGTQTIKQVDITSGYNQVNLTTSFNAFFGSNISARLGMWDISLGYNNTDLNLIANGLVGYYHFDNSTEENSTWVKDWSGKGNNGIVFNLNWTPNGKYGGAFQFIYPSAINNITVLNSNSITIRNQSTISFWTKRSLNGSNWEDLLVKTSTNGMLYSIYFSVNNGCTFKKTFYNGSGGYYTLDNGVSNCFLNDSLFHHYSFVYNLSGRFVKGYRDGVNIFNNTINTAYSDNDTSISNLMMFDNKGSIDEVMIFNRSLSQSEVTEIYTKGRLLFNYTDYQNLSNNGNIFNMSTNTTNLLTDFLMNAGNSSSNAFYTPNLGSSAGITLTTYNLDVVYPVFSNNITNPSSPTNWIITKDYIFNNTIDYSNGTAGLEFNGINYTITNVSNNFTKTLSNLQAGTYNYYFWAYGNGNLNRYNTSIIRSYIINQNNTYILGISGTTPIIYLTITNVLGSNCPSQLNCNLDKSNQIYGVGIVSFNYSTNGNANYSSNSIVSDITINPSNSLCQVFFNSSNPSNYPSIFKVYSGCNSIFTLTRNGTIVSNNSEQNLGAGIYNFTVQRTDIQNYTNVNEEQDFVLNKATPSLSLTSSSGWTIPASTYSTITGNNCPNQLTCNLYQSGVSQSNPFTNIFPAGNYQFIYNTTGNVNYTIGSTINTLISQINGTSGINGTINIKSKKDCSKGSNPYCDCTIYGNC